jgi:hypothetical protein
MKSTEIHHHLIIMMLAHEEHGNTSSSHHHDVGPNEKTAIFSTGTAPLTASLKKGVGPTPLPPIGRSPQPVLSPSFF